MSDASIIEDYMRRPARYLGPIVVGALVDHVLMGMVITQTWRYYSHYSKDAVKLRALVALLFLVNLTQTGFVLASMFKLFAVGYGRWENLITQVFFEAIMMLEAISGALSQIFFLERAVALLRLWRVHAGWAMVVIAVPSVLATLGLGLGSGIIPLLLANDSTDFDTFALWNRFIIAWKSVGTATDLLLTGTILTCLCLSRNGRRSTDSLLESIARWTIEAQSLPLIASILFLCANVADPNGNYAIIPSLMEGKLAALSVLHVLNSRLRLQGGSVVQSTGNLADFSANNGRTMQRSPLSSAATCSKKSEPVRSTSVQVSTLHELDLEAYARAYEDVEDEKPSRGESPSGRGS